MNRLANLMILSSSSLHSHIWPRGGDAILTTPLDSPDGSFIFPRKYPLAFLEGSSINISWSTTYQNSDLYLFQSNRVANPIQVATNLATNWYQWEVRTEETNLKDPFLFKIVNALGATEAQSPQGFFSASWYIARDDNASGSVTSSSSATSTAPSTSSEISSSSITTSGGPETPDDGVSKDVIIGLTVGIVMAVAIIIVGLLYCLKKRQRRKDAISSYYDKLTIQMQPEYTLIHEACASPRYEPLGPVERYG